MADDDGSITGGDIAAAYAAQEASPASDPSTGDSPAASTSADAIVPPAEPSSGEVTSTQPGVPPEGRWPSILDNARREAAARAEEAWKPYEWAKQVDQNQFNEMVGWYQRANADPVTFAQELIQSLQQHPVHGQALRSLAAKALSSGRGQEEPQPDLPLQLEDGRTVHLYSAQQLAKREAWLRSQITQQLHTEMQPFKAMQKAQEQQAAADAATSFATTLTGNLGKLPGFNEHKADIAKWIANARLESDHPAEVRAAALEAYTAIVVPKLSTSVRQGVLTDLQHKAGAATVNPSHARTSAPKTMDEMSVSEALSYELAKAAG